jgi:outer membrane protein assembly factor BamB
LHSGYFQAPSAQWGFASSPVIHNGMVLVQADVQKGSFLAALDLESGKELWRTPRNDVPTFSSPAVVPHREGRMQVVLNGWKHIGGYDLKTGRELWKMAGTGDIPVPTPVSANGLVVITSAHGGGRPVYAVRPQTGEVAWKLDRAGNYMQTPLLHEGLGYFCYDNGVLSVYQLATGERVYQQRLGAGSAGFTSSPVAAAGRLYITDETGHSFVLKLGSEFQSLGENELGEAVMASPAISRGVLYLRGRYHLFAIGEK